MKITKRIMVFGGSALGAMVVLSVLVAIAPVPCPGQQGLWQVGEDWLPAVQSAYGTALKGVAKA
jgi:hypothetical protein